MSFTSTHIMRVGGSESPATRVNETIRLAFLAAMDVFEAPGLFAAFGLPASLDR